MRIIWVDNPLEAWNRINEAFLETEEGIQQMGKYFMHIYDVSLVCKTAQFPKDEYLESIGYSKAKIKSLIGTYLDAQDLAHFINYIKYVYNNFGEVFGDIGMNTKKSKKLKTGSCILGITFKFRKKFGGKLTFYSRAAEFPHKAFADVMLMSALANVIRTICGIKQISCAWTISTAWIKSSDSPYYVVYKLPEEIYYKNKYFHDYMQRGKDKFLVRQEKAMGSSLRRLQKFYLNKTSGELPGNTGIDEFTEILLQFYREGNDKLDERPKTYSEE